MNQVVKNRLATEQELETTQKSAMQLWGARLNQGIKTTTAYAKAGYWTAMAGFNRWVNKNTSEKVSDSFENASKVGVAFTVGALIATPILPALPLAMGAATVGSYVAGKITQALHGYTQNNLLELDNMAIESQVKALDAEDEYYQIDGDYEEQREVEREARQKEREEKREARERAWNDFKAETREDWNDFKAETREDWNDFKAGAKKVFKAIGNKVKNVANSVADEVVGIAEAVRDESKAIKADIEASNYYRKEERKEKWDNIKFKAREVSAGIRSRMAEAKFKRSKKCLNFLTTTTMCLGKEWIAEHLLTDVDKRNYEEALEEDARFSAKKKDSIQSKLEFINEKRGTTYTVKDYEKMRPKQQAKLDELYENLKELDNENEVVL